MEGVSEAPYFLGGDEGRVDGGDEGRVDGVDLLGWRVIVATHYDYRIILVCNQSHI